MVISSAQAKANRYDNKQRRIRRMNMERLSFKKKLEKPYSIRLAPDYLLSFKGKPKYAEWIILSFKAPILIRDLERRVHIAFGDLPTKKEELNEQNK